VENLRIFGCPVYSHIPKDKRNKLEPSRKKGIFMGYSDSSKAYRIYIPEQHKIKVSRDVTFNERMAFRKSIEEIIEEEELEEPNEENTENENNEKDQPDHPMEPCENIDSDIIPKTKKRQLGLKLHYKTQKDSRFQKEHPGRVKDQKDSQVMQHT
jgi:hypothetical protein